MSSEWVHVKAVSGEQPFGSDKTYATITTVDGREFFLCIPNEILGRIKADKARGVYRHIEVTITNETSH